jgi:hypothetical protein
MTFSIPDNDILEYHGLPTAARNRVQWMLHVMGIIAGANKNRVKICEQIAATAGLHYNSIYNTWLKFRDSKFDWRALLDKRKTPEFWRRDPSKTIGLPHDFIQYWKTECEQNQRAFKPAWRLLIHRWQSWHAGDLTKAIPGYTMCPPRHGRSDYPKGWTYSNLLNHAPNDIEVASARQGREAALALLPSITTTRVGSYPFAEIQFDDMWHDFEVNAPRQSQSCRLLEFNCVDFFSNYIFKPGLKPRLRNQDDGKRKHLDSRDFKIFWLNWLLDFGCHPDGTVFNVENGTSAISREDEEKLLFWFRGLLTIKRSGMSGTPAFAGAHRERAKGNFRVKALKEGAGKMIHNQLAHLPGQVGMHRNNLPATHHGRSEENRALIFLQAAVPALADKLQLGFLDLAEAVYAVNEAYGLLNDRKDHDIEGWEEAGLVYDAISANPSAGIWIPLSEMTARMDDHQRSILSLQLATHPQLKRRFKYSPNECMTQNTTRLIKLPDAAVPDLLGKAFGTVETVTNGIIKFTRPEFHGKLRYNAVYQDADGFRRRLDNDSRVLCHFNPFKPDYLYLTDANDGRYLGKATRDLIIRRDDTDAIQRQFGKIQSDLKDAVTETAHRHGLSRIPGMALNTQILRNANKPSLRDQSINTDTFDSSEMLESPDFATVADDPSTYFDPQDLL